jgi:hypothetical protein
VLDTSHINKVKAPQHFKTPRSHGLLRLHDMSFGDVLGLACVWYARDALDATDTDNAPVSSISLTFMSADSATRPARSIDAVRIASKIEKETTHVIVC